MGPSVAGCREKQLAAAAAETPERAWARSKYPAKGMWRAEKLAQTSQVVREWPASIAPEVGVGRFVAQAQRIVAKQRALARAAELRGDVEPLLSAHASAMLADLDDRGQVGKAGWGEELGEAAQRAILVQRLEAELLPRLPLRNGGRGLRFLPRAGVRPQSRNFMVSGLDHRGKNRLLRHLNIDLLHANLTHAREPGGHPATARF